MKNTGFLPHAEPTARSGAGRADQFGHFAVAAGLADRDTLQLLPHSPLERGALHVEWQLARRDVAVDAAQDLCDDVGEQRVVAGDVGAGELVTQDRLEHQRVGTVEDATDPALGRGDEQRAEP